MELPKPFPPPHLAPPVSSSQTVWICVKMMNPVKWNLAFWGCFLLGWVFGLLARGYKLSATRGLQLLEIPSVTHHAPFAIPLQQTIQPVMSRCSTYIWDNVIGAELGSKSNRERLQFDCLVFRKRSIYIFTKDRISIFFSLSSLSFWH